MSATVASRPSALDRVPPEILNHIFTLGSGPISFNDIKPFPLLISQVCGRWRDIALANSRLWTTISCTRDAPRFPILKLLLERSHTQPLNLYFDFTSPKDYIETYPCPAARHPITEHHPFADEEYESPFYLTDTDKVRKRLTLLTTHRPLRTYSVTSNNYSFVSLSLRSFPLGPAPHLIDFSVSYIPGYEDISRWGTVHVPLNGVAPRLESVRLRGLDLYWGASTFITGLTSLELRDHDSRVWISHPRLQAILTSNPGLETLVLDNSGPLGVADEWPVEEVLDMRSLKRLVFARQRAEEGAAILKRLRLPALRQLEIDLPVMGQEREEGVHDEIMRLLVPLVEKLEVLRIEEVHCSERALCAFVAALTNLRVLVVNNNEHLLGDSLSFIQHSTPSTLISLLAECVHGSSPLSPAYVPRLSTLVLASLNRQHIHSELDFRAPILSTVYTSLSSASTPNPATESIPEVDAGRTVNVGEIEWRRWCPVDDGEYGVGKIDLFDIEGLLSRVSFQ
ncbi:uncharacterized protein STEHIDRAFT_167204 [Stereum hirsutum FP-91666 SS1]|uniref:uncharacterized protein n=1 Tax=Stereum hirsutum (strain FP-91666) TaxID=721885 RepID=UPI000440B433|nr:uncharacterized protein STEHIDRAFT_167204 [Stereum hirsutum FP-91666 SS1]EIM89432.1 hypothetical protein STEHIDRAFT_167204 [Stereum hirsutum FP-91666 SS1]